MKSAVDNNVVVFWTKVSLRRSNKPANADIVDGVSTDQGIANIFAVKFIRITARQGSVEF